MWDSHFMTLAWEWTTIAKQSYVSITYKVFHLFIWWEPEDRAQVNNRSHIARKKILENRQPEPENPHSRYKPCLQFCLTLESYMEGRSKAVRLRLTEMTWYLKKLLLNLSQRWSLNLTYLPAKTKHQHSLEQCNRI